MGVGVNLPILYLIKILYISLFSYIPFQIFRRFHTFPICYMAYFGTQARNIVCWSRRSFTVNKHKLVYFYRLCNKCRHSNGKRSVRVYFSYEDFPITSWKIKLSCLVLFSIVGMKAINAWILFCNPNICWNTTNKPLK